jgi:hypothetical protein
VLFGNLLKCIVLFVCGGFMFCEDVIGSTWDGEPIGDEEAVSFRLKRDEQGVWITWEAPFHDDPAPPGAGGHTDGLWEYEVVEFFFVGEGEPVPYLEVECSPHGHHLVLVLRGVRQAVGVQEELAYTAHIDGKRWSGEVQIPAAWLPEGALRWNAYAIHGVGAARRYLAMTPVPGEAPDFHRLHCFRGC